MKKLMILAAMFGFVACGGADKAEEKDDAQVVEEAVEATEEATEEVVEEVQTAAAVAAPEVKAEKPSLEDMEVKQVAPAKAQLSTGKEVVKEGVEAAKVVPTKVKTTVDGAINTAELKVVGAGEQVITRVEEGAKEITKETKMKVQNQLVVK